MKLSRKFLNDYVDTSDIELKQLAEDMTSIGNEYDYAGKLINCTNLVIGEVVECENHPNSDHLHLCKVNIGNEVLKIVCGAPNVRKGIKVIVALDGAVLPGGTIKRGVIRGEESNGMLCSIEELGLEHKFLEEADINGICELGSDAIVGEDPIKYLNLDDEVIDFELTSNRGDLLSILGMAYEVGALYNRKVNDIELNCPKKKVDLPKFNLNIETKRCNLFLARRILNVEIKESPDFIKKRLIASGIRPINNVVDISNYVMLETGQPLHFYDYDRLGDTLVVRDAKHDEKLVTLDNIERNLDEGDIVIANKDEAVGLAGVMGGLSTEVLSDTKNILIESAIFDSVSIRLTSKKILRSEASNRFEKGLDPKRTYMAMERSSYLLAKYANATVVDELITFDESNKEDKVISITPDFINGLLGLEIKKEEIIDIFERLGFIVEENSNTLTVTVPTRRIDISIKEDLVEEVARIYGIDKISGTLPHLPTKRGSYNKFLRYIRERLVDLGLSETLSYTLIPNSEVHKYTKEAFEEINLLDPMSDDHRTLRNSLLPSMMMTYDYNAKRNNKDLCLFEIGKNFKKIDGKYVETRSLAILMSGNYTEGLNREKVTFYHIKGIMENLLDYLGFSNRYSLVISDFPEEFHPKASAYINLNGKNIGIIGKVHPNVSKDDIYLMEINLDMLENLGVKKIEYQEISKYPSIMKDLAFVADKNISNETLMHEIKKAGGKYLTNIELFDLYEGDKLENNKRSLAYNLTFMDKDNTLTDEIVMPIFEKIINDVETKLKVQVRDK